MRRFRNARIMLAMVLLACATAGLAVHARAEAPPKKVTISVTADKLDYDRTTDVYLAEGNVKIEQEGVRLEARKVVLNNKTGEARAEGGVYLQDKEEVIHAERLTINLNTREGVVYQGRMFMKKDNYHLKGDLIERRSETVYHVEHGEFTTCDEGDWFIKAEEMDIDMAKYATGRAVSFKIAGAPVFYTPYFLFPVRRQSGLLIPAVGYNSSYGFFMDNALFWAISDYTDMTLYSDYRTRLGHGTGAEYRYRNSRESLGQVYTKFWDLHGTSASRWDFRFEHWEEFAEDLSARADINLVSDEHYYHDLERTLQMRSKPYVDSNAFYVERWNASALSLLGQYSIDLTRTNEKTAQKLPELRYTIFEETLAGPFRLNFDGSATNFQVQGVDGVRRMDLSPQLTAAFGGGGLSLAPRAGVRATFYDRSADSAEPAERKFFFAGADLNSRLSRVYGSDAEAGIGRVRHSIEPTLSYTYIPHVDQGSIPQFDAVDTVAALNATRLAVINRLTAHYKESKDSRAYTTFDLLVFKLSQSYDLGPRDGSATSPVRSDILAELYARTPKAFSFTGSSTYSTYTRVVSSYSAGGVYTTGPVSLNLTEQYLRQPATRFLIGGGGLRHGRWDFGAQWWRDVQNDRTTQEEYRAHYASQCWGIGFSYVIKPGESSFMAMLDLKGIGGRVWGQ